MKNPYDNFDDFGLRHLPTYLIERKRWIALEDFLTDLHFIEKKCVKGMTSSLINDYTCALNTNPSLRQTPFEEFANFVSNQSHLLSPEHASHQGFVFQQAYNWSVSGFIAEVIEYRDPESCCWIRRLNRPLAPNTESSIVFSGHQGAITCLEILPDQKTLVSASYDGTVRLWNIETGECKNVLKCPDTMNRDPMELFTLAVEQSGHFLAAASGNSTTIQGFNGGIYIWNLDTFELFVQTTGYRPLKNVDSLAFLDNSMTLVSLNSDGNIEIWGGHVWIPQITIDSQSLNFFFNASRKTTHKVKETQALLLSKDGRRAVNLSLDNLSVIDTLSGETLATWKIRDFEAASLSEDGQTLIVAVYETHELLAYDLLTGELKFTLNSHSARVTVIKEILVHHLLLSADQTGQVIVWDIRLKKVFRTFFAGASVSSLALSNDGKYSKTKSLVICTLRLCSG